MHILAFLIRRALQAVIVMFVISLIGFSIQDNLGDPLRELVGQSVSEEERDALREELGLNDPFMVQYVRFLGNAVQGDLGTSYFFKRPALDVIMDKFPATFELVLGAVFIFLSVSIPAGIYCAINRDSFFARVIMTGSIVGISIPVFLTAIMLVWIFGVELNWLPAFGRGDTVELPWGWETGLLTVDRFMNVAMSYPANYGYIPKTLAGDGDPVDVLVLTPHPIVAGSVIKCRAVAVLDTEDEGTASNATIVTTDIEASNGVIHKIDFVLLPTP